MQLLSLAASIVCLVCWIMVLVKMFKTSILTGVLGFFCGLYAYIWGWMNKAPHNLQKLMLIWTICILLSLVLTYMAGGAAFNMPQ